MYKKSSCKNSYLGIGRLSMMRYAFIENEVKANRQKHENSVQQFSRNRMFPKLLVVN